MTSPREFEQRPAGVAGIERGIGLDDVVDQATGTRAQRTTERADDAGGDRLLKTHRTADGDRDLAGRHPVRISQEERGKSTARDAHDGEVGFRVVADQFGTSRAAVGKMHPQVGRAVDDVAVRHQIAIGGDEEPRAGTAGLLCARPHLDMGHGGGGAVEDMRTADE